MEEISNEIQEKIINFNNTKRKKWMHERKPYSVLFEVTPHCNMNCIHCYLQKEHVSSEMTYEHIIGILDALCDIGILFITFTGGEIFTRKDFIDIYRYAKRKGFLVELFTNGYLINDEVIELLREYPPLLVDVSIYGATEETYKKVTGVAGALEVVLSNCKKMKDNGIRVSLKTPVIMPIFNELESIKSIASSLDIPFVYTFDICATIDGDLKTKELSVPLSAILENEFLDYYRQMEHKGRKTLQFDKGRLNEIEELKNVDTVYACNVALNSFVIDYKGNICPCMKLRHKGEEFSRETYDYVWKEFGSYAREKASDKYKCMGCSQRYFCDVCPAEMDMMYGDDQYRPDYVCTIANIRKAFYCGEISYSDAIRIAKQFERREKDEVL